MLLLLCLFVYSFTHSFEIYRNLKQRFIVHVECVYRIRVAYAMCSLFSSIQLIGNFNHLMVCTIENGDTSCTHKYENFVLFNRNVYFMFRHERRFVFRVTLYELMVALCTLYTPCTLFPFFLFFHLLMLLYIGFFLSAAAIAAAAGVAVAVAVPCIHTLYT